MEKQRIDAIDIAKGLGILLVYIGHVPPCKFVVRFIYNFHMPLFFFLSGLFLDEKKYGFKDFVINRSKSLLIPLVTFCVFAKITNYIPEFNFRNDLLSLGLGGAALWFLPVLYCSELIVFCLWKLFKKQYVRLCLCFSFFAVALIVSRYSPIQPFLVFALHAVPLASAFLSLGSVLGASVMDYYKYDSKCYIWFYALSLVILIGCAYLIKDFNNMCYGHLMYGFWGCLLAFIGILMIIILSKYIDVKNVCILKRILVYCGQNSLAIFGLHLSFKGIYIRVFGDMTINSPLHYMLGNLGILGGVFLLILFINKRLSWCIGK